MKVYILTARVINFKKSFVVLSFIACIGFAVDLWGGPIRTGSWSTESGDVGFYISQQTELDSLRVRITFTSGNCSGSIIKYAYGVSIIGGSFSKDLGSSYDGSTGSVSGTFSGDGTTCNGSYTYNNADCGTVSSSWTATPTGEAPLDEDTVQIVDPKFLNALIEEGVDANGSGIISHAEAESVHELILLVKEISDMTGIEAFVNLESLTCISNLLTSLDVSNNTALTYLNCGSNDLTTLDVSGNTGLINLNCRNNELTILDVSNNTALTDLDCHGNLLSSLDISNNSALEALHCSSNQLTALDVTQNTALQTLTCGKNQIISLNLSNNQNLGTDIFSNIDLDLSSMPTLTKVCVWVLPFPPGDIDLDVEGSPNLYFTTDCGDMDAPELFGYEDTLNQPASIRAMSTEDGMIYLVPDNTGRILEDILVACLDSVPAVAGEEVEISIADLASGEYLLYARDDSNNLSTPHVFTITGVGINPAVTGQIRIFPNPVNHQLDIQAEAFRRYSIEITTLNGRIVQQEAFEGKVHRLDLSSLQAGFYFITIRSKDFVKTEKIVKLSR